MVSINKNKVDEILNTNTLEPVFYYTLRNKPLINNSFKGDNLLAFKGYNNQAITQEEANQFFNAKGKLFDCTNNIYKFIGVVLASGNKQVLTEKFNQLSNKNKFAICLFYDDFNIYLKNEVFKIVSLDSFTTLLKLLYSDDDMPSNEEMDLINIFSLYDINDVLDIILLEELNKKFNKISYNNIPPLDIIKTVFTNLQDAIDLIQEAQQKLKELEENKNDTRTT